MVVGGLLIQAAAPARGRRSRRATGGAVRRRPYRDDAAAHGATRIDQQFEPYPGRPLRRRDVPRRRLPGVRLGGLRRGGRRRSRHRRGARSATSSPPTTSAGSSTRSSPRARSRAARSRPSATRRSRRSSCATGATSTTGSRRTSSRPRSTRRGSTTILVEAPFSGAPHGAKGVGELPMDVGAPAVVAAIHDATGVWIHDLPATPERILAALAGVAGGRAARPGASSRRVRPRPAPMTDVPLHGQRRRRSRSTCPGCAACSTSCARTSA